MPHTRPCRKARSTTSRWTTSCRCRPLAPLLARVVSTPPYEGGARCVGADEHRDEDREGREPGRRRHRAAGPRPRPTRARNATACCCRSRRRDACASAATRATPTRPRACSPSINEAIEDALWNTVRAIDEGERYIRHLAEHLPPAGSRRADRFAHEAVQARRQSEAVRQLVNGREASRQSDQPITVHRSPLTVDRSPLVLACPCPCPATGLDGFTGARTQRSFRRLVRPTCHRRRQ